MRDDHAAYPIERAKVQAPVLRPETLERNRLIEWLHAKTRGRLVLILAEAGFGKTTLLADFTRRTRLTTLWFRLDAGDRDWVSLVHHLVASGREWNPEFASETLALLASPQPGRDAVLASLLTELEGLSERGAVLIFDDFHTVDSETDVLYLTGELLRRTPERVSIVISSRRTPRLATGKLRAAGEVSELTTDDLRFDTAETTTLFQQTYGRELDDDVLADLVDRTEGWAASLSLVHAALGDRSPSEARRFVRTLTGADHELHDYLAEVVVGTLDDELQRFLMKTSILQVVTPDLAQAALGLDAKTTARLTSAAERLTLLSRSGRQSNRHQRYHPLVREFLQARLTGWIGASGVVALHRQIAAAAGAADWRLAAHHFQCAGDESAMLQTVAFALPRIMGEGQFHLAQRFLEDARTASRPGVHGLITSRIGMQHGEYESAVAASIAVLESAGSDQVQIDHALLNLVTLNLNFGDGEKAVSFAARLAKSEDENLAMIARASEAMVKGSEADDIEAINRLLRVMAKSQRSGRAHHFAITQYNLASNLLVQDRPLQALAAIETAIGVLEDGSAAIELAAARVLRAEALAMLGRVLEANVPIALGDDPTDRHQEEEIAIGSAEVLDSYVDPPAGRAKFASIDPERISTPAGQRLAALSLARMFARQGRHSEAANAAQTFPLGRPAHLGIRSEQMATAAYLAVARGDKDACDAAEAARKHASRQGAHRWRRCAELLLAMTAPAYVLSNQVVQLGRESPHTLSFVAELLADRLDIVDGHAIDAIKSVAVAHQERWRQALRPVIDARSSAAIAAADVLELIGDKDDVRRLRKLARDAGRHPGAAQLGRALARRLAHPIYIEDQGRVSIRIGSREIPGTAVRRKVLALVCFLLSRPQLSSTRDQVLEALWPDLDPEVAANSLNQTLFFLRRVFERDYVEDLSPGYVHHDSDVIWFDRELVTSRSDRCRELIQALPRRPSPDEVEGLSQLYQGRFALDFEYEEWAAAHRDSIHAAYLEIVERSVSEDVATGHHDRGIQLARRALDIDSSADGIEAALLRMYRVTGAHSAAAEQYGHYAAVMRSELGIEPVPLESL